jgi:hypothetical protein
VPFSSCIMTFFVSRLASLTRSSLGPARYHRWTISQLAFVTNAVLVLPCTLIYSPPIAPYIWLKLDRCCCCSVNTLFSRVSDLLVAAASYLAWWGLVRACLNRLRMRELQQPHPSRW